MKNLTDSNEWRNLIAHYDSIANEHMRDWFSKDTTRFNNFNLTVGDILLDYSRNRICDETIDLLCQLASSFQLRQKITALFNGEPINATENRPALHTALRDQSHKPIFVNGSNVATEIENAQEIVAQFVDQVISGEWRGATGKTIKHVINIGIGGSYTGPKMCTEALKDFAVNPLKFYFVSTVDKYHLDDILAQIDPETSLFIISSKSFSTIETLTNAKTIITWMHNNLKSTETTISRILEKHFIAVTAQKEKAIKFGIRHENIFPIWEWVGGRYSVWSAIGLPLMLMIGNSQFSEFLSGAHEMDIHFNEADYSKNMPVLMALISIWYTNFFGATVQAIIPYSYRLRSLVTYFQQAEMESNGKSTSINGDSIPYTTGPVIFGEEGCNGQHTYHQLLHQGRHLIPVDMILIGSKTSDIHHDILMASALSQAQALMCGKTKEEAHEELTKSEANSKSCSDENTKLNALHRVIPGNKPSNLLFLRALSPKNLGALIALYEHKIFVQGVIWSINSFDQWGVELGKQLLPSILKCLQANPSGSDSKNVAGGIIEHLKK